MVGEGYDPEPEIRALPAVTRVAARVNARNARKWSQRRLTGPSGGDVADQNTLVRMANKAHKVKITEAIITRMVPMVTARALTR